ncbi:MAG: tetratricopeptide repeat protein, partial [Thermoanaerobaculia bacterium]
MELLALVRESAGDAVGPAQARWLGRLRAERENLEAAIEWAQLRGETALALGLANAVWRLWLVSDPLHRSVARVEALLRLPGAGDAERERAVALNTLGTLRNEMGELEPAREALEESLSIFRRLGERGEAYARSNLAWAEHHRGRYDQAEELPADEALSILGQIDDDQLIAWGLGIRSLPALARGETGRALDLLHRSASLWRRVGNRAGLAWTLGTEGQALVAAGRRAEAIESLRQAVVACREASSPWPLLDVLPQLAALGAPRGKADELPADPLAEAARLADRLGA